MLVRQSQRGFIMLHTTLRGVTLLICVIFVRTLKSYLF